MFKNEDGSSKIAYIWDQTRHGKGPAGFHYGVEYTNDEINEALKSESPRSIIPHQDTVGHGTFMASVAARKWRWTV